ncbi:Hydroxymethylglutaryl-CoA synthase [Alteracholeplasma palmae J233]|uniref:Hydroxymethylglutaryl-CoA synthase n=1 Tax=Alteracholeplasma palmae (strain ATCC 49389 / J233) TaxID=1318466 RepID=U4KLM3_ALTPJ|nr:hydroxymethylglutaryl-CoA synthase [Alteracholeplasma palmae]CCV64777.1 Hydroxymethylglutaryl-CoA synthase [Alteracholeplasma palmae J233]
MKIGIDKIAFYSPGLYINLSDLAIERKIDPDKFLIGIGQIQMSVPSMMQDTITMAINASNKILTKEDKEKIDLVIFATESSVDQSKSGATFIHKLLELNNYSRSIEIKQACYGATAGIQLGYSHILNQPESKVLVIASDIARYGLDTAGEPTQGAGSVAILLTKNPSILEIENKSSYYTEDIFDFYRPNYSDLAIVDGKYSNDKYQEFFSKTYNAYMGKYQMSVNDFDAFCFHIPYTKIGLKSLRMIADETKSPNLFENYKLATIYNKRVGNIYTGSLYLSLISLLEQGNLKKNDRIGLYSYGSGAVGEFFSLRVVDGYKNCLQKASHEKMLDSRIQLTIDEYENIFKNNYTETLKNKIKNENTIVYFNGVVDHKRIYLKK